MSAGRWAFSGIGTALLAGLVWWFGPLWSPLEPALPRIAAVQALAFFWAVGNATLDWRERRRADSLGAGLTPAVEERTAVAQSLARALALLGKRRRAALLDLPWYAIIGPPGAGKTTALLNAGLSFPLAAELGRAPVPGAGGTRLCDWWFTSSAVLIDTAGRYTTQDSNAEVDRAGWSAFLALLKRARPAQPLNGVIVAIGAADIAQASPAERTAHAAAIASRLAELEETFGRRLPVYGLFTKVDLISGFVEFFDDLDPAARDQVWGETFPLDAPGATAAERFETALRALAEHTAARMTRRLAAETRPDRRLPILGFPTQIASLTPALATFATAALGPSMVRGLYLASGTQEGTPIDRLAGTMSRVFGVPPRRVAHAGQGRSYFLGRLLQEVVFGEAMLVQRDPVLERRRRWFRRAGFAIVALLFAGAAGFVIRTSQRAGEQLEPLTAALGDYNRDAQPIGAETVADGDLHALVPLLDQARDLSNAVPPAIVPLGLSQAAKLQAGARIVYRDALTNALFPRLLWRLEADMRGVLLDPVRLYEKLRVYLMLGGTGPLDIAAVRSWFTQDWRRTDPEDETILPQALAHLDALLAEPLPPVTLDTPLVQTARTSIERVPVAARVYAALKASAAAAGLAPWRPADSLGPAGTSLFTRASGASMNDGIPGLFTATGFRTVLLPALPAVARQVAAETWVTGQTAEPVPPQQVQQGIQALYAAEFGTLWDRMLADLSIAPIGSLPQAAQALYIVASPESPVRALLRSLSAQLNLPGEPALAARYAPLVGLTIGDGTALDRSLRLVADIQQALAKIAALPLGNALPAGGEDIGASLQLEAARQPPPFGRWLGALAATSTALRTGDARRQLSLLYNAPGGPAQSCAAAVTRYPFSIAGSVLSDEEFARVFGPAGALDGFLNTRLKPFLDTATLPWTIRPGAPLAAGDAVAFQRANAIRAAFFPPNGIAVAFPVELAPATPSRVATLNLGGVAVETGKGIAKPALVTWPPPSSNPAEATLQSDLPGVSTRETGLWALHRLVARARLRPAGKPGTDLLLFGNLPDQAAFTLRSTALSSGLLTDFRCPAVP